MCDHTVHDCDSQLFVLHIIRLVNDKSFKGPGCWGQYSGYILTVNIRLLT